MIKLVNESQPSIGVGALQDLLFICPFFIFSRSRQSFAIKNNNDIIILHICIVVFMFQIIFFSVLTISLLGKQDKQVTFVSFRELCIHKLNKIYRKKRRKQEGSRVWRISDHLEQIFFAIIKKFIFILIFYYCHQSLLKSLKY